MKKSLLIIVGIALLSFTASAEEPIKLSSKNTESKSTPYHLNSTRSVKKSKYSSDPENCIKLKVVPLLFRMASLQYERRIKDNMTVACDVNLLFLSATVDGATLSYSGFGLSPELRFYPGGEAMKGFFIGPYLSYLGMSLKGEVENTAHGKGTGEISGITAIGGGALLGWKWIFADVFALETHIGINYLSLTMPDKVDYKYADGTSGSEPISSFSGAGILPTGGLSLGYAF
ncbi:MAG: DUF3575 domain-containing protein [Bacteroidota bacterium]|jgi:hypothetical protein